MADVGKYGDSITLIVGELATLAGKMAGLATHGSPVGLNDCCGVALRDIGS
jgi:hypothetical protein